MRYIFFSFLELNSSLFQVLMGFPVWLWLNSSINSWHACWVFDYTLHTHRHKTRHFDKSCMYISDKQFLWLKKSITVFLHVFFVCYPRSRRENCCVCLNPGMDRIHWATITDIQLRKWLFVSNTFLKIE